MKDGTPGLSRIISTDYTALLGAILPLVGVLLWIGNKFFGFPSRWRGREIQQGDSTFLWIAAAMVIVGVLLLLWRIHTFQSLFIAGHRVPGRVTTVSFFRDRGRIEYEYQYAGASHHAGNAIHKNKRTMAIQQGMPVTIVVDPANPKRTILLDLYV